ncbi:MAG: hypothetical protein PHI34_12705 [Acidobacteriota bacterium]|nr:hypothetical protein [Acidobacteriota bacterium]
MKRLTTSLLLAGAIVFSLGGIGAFILLFIPWMNIYWLILSPLILAVYQIPAVVLVWLWKRRKRREAEPEPGQEPGPDKPTGDL